MGRFDGQVALVTAAAGAGIGQAVARKLGQEGAHLVLSDAHPRRMTEVALQISHELGREVVGMEVDVTNPDQVNAFIQAAVERHGRVDILVNNAGLNKLAPVWEMDNETWKRVLDVNLNGTFYATRAVLPHMMRARKGVIVNMASMHGYLGPDAGEAHYAAAKAGIMGFTRAVAAEVGKHGVRVVALSPGLIYNPFLERIYPKEFFDGIVKHTPLGRTGKPEDVANLIAFLCSDEASFITGEVVNITGGFYMAP
ncbi:MAG: SDR family oxidoreductase [Dehalococcoidia bacterium]|nr:SDR family oxidoreductase [Dehalococcoidia bacterium]